MKLVDSEETVLIVVAEALDDGHPDRQNAALLQEAINERGRGFAYRRALVVSDVAWFDARMLQRSPTIAIGGPGVNGVSGSFAPELPTVWSDDDRVVIQANLRERARRAALWGVDRGATAEAVNAFIDRGWLDEFLNRCWRFQAGMLA